VSHIFVNQVSQRVIILAVVTRVFISKCNLIVVNRNIDLFVIIIVHALVIVLIFVLIIVVLLLIFVIILPFVLILVLLIHFII